MAFEGLTEKLAAAFKKLRGKGRLSEADVKEAMREIRHVTTKTLLIAALWAILALLLLPWQAAIVAPVLMIGQTLLIMRISNKRIGGYTGDVLGAVECLAELTLLLVTLVVTIYA